MHVVTKRYKVTNHGMILYTDKVTGRRMRLKPGDTIPDGAMSSETIREHVKSGYLVEAGTPILEQKDFRPDTSIVVGGKQVEHSENAALSIASAPADQAPTVQQRLVPATEAPAAPAVETPPAARAGAKWNFTPTELAGKSRDQLNALIATVDPTMPPQETVEDAISVLTAEA